MTERKPPSLICALSQGSNIYRINNVTFNVDSHFEPFESGMRLNDRIARILLSDLVPLTAFSKPYTMAAEYVSSAAGKEA